MSGPAIASSLDVRVDNQIGFAFHVTNNASSRLELTFPNGQTHEIAVFDSAGRALWRWSEGRMFTQVLQNKVLEAEQTLTYEATWKGALANGTYVAVASLMSQNQPLEQRVEFTIP